MPLPHALRESLADPDFWASYRFESDDDYFGDAEEDEHVVRFEVGGGHAVELSVADGYVDLGVRSPADDEAVSIAWDDEAHPHPHVLRRDELDLVCRAAALVEPELRHPGPGVALLSRFLVLTDDVDAARATVRAAHAVLLADGGDPAVSGLQGVVWSRDGAGHHRVDQAEDHDGADLYSTRTSDEESEFPHELWRALLDHAERTLASAVDPAWTVPTDAAPAEVARALEAAGCTDRTVLRALADPAHPAETAWVLELLTGAPRGSLWPATDADR